MAEQEKLSSVEFIIEPARADLHILLNKGESKGMVHVKRDQHGHIVAASQEQQPNGWESVPADSPELAAFAAVLAGGQQNLTITDLGLARVLEDLIELLMKRDVIRFTDFPEVAQKKLLARRSIRSSLHSLKLLNENGGDDFL